MEARPCICIADEWATCKKKKGHVQEICETHATGRDGHSYLKK